MEIEILNEQTDLDLSALPITQIIEEFLKFKEVYGDEIAVHFVDSDKITLLHKEFFNDPTPTDCITFPMDIPIPLTSSTEIKDYCHLGEIFICPATAIAYCKTHGGAPLKETMLYLIHGLLHLLEYDDIEIQAQTEMRTQEKIAMEFLTKKIPF